VSRLGSAVAAILVLVPGTAAAHDAFGDLGPFYTNLLHPLADPGQALVLAGFAVLLARQPIETVRRGYAVHAFAAAATVALAALIAVPPPGALATGVLAAGLGGVALFGRPLPRTAVIVLGAAAAGLAALAAERVAGLRAGTLAALGAATGLAVASLLLWSAFDLLQRRIGGIACAVAGSWVAAIGIMMTALPS
jgi:hypothetical protein